MKKTDGGRNNEKRGTGRGSKYKSWLKVHEFSSSGRVHRLLGWKKKRIYQLMSDLELYYFLIIQWQDNVIDIREQFPLLPIEQTIDIAERLNIKHPSLINKTREDMTMTTDFLITVRKDNLIFDVARTIKPMNQLKNKRVIEKFKIEKEYWTLKNIDWGIITENEIDKVLAQNIYYMYNDYFWNEEKGYSNNRILGLVKEIKILLENNNTMEAIRELELSQGWEIGEGINFVKHLIIRKIVKVDMSRKLNFMDLEIWF